MMNGHCYSNGENRVCYREESIREGVAIREPERRCATISLRQKLKVGRACMCADANRGHKMLQGRSEEVYQGVGIQ